MDKKLGKKRVKQMLKEVGIKVSKATLEELVEGNQGAKDIIAFILGYLSQESPLFLLGEQEGRIQPYR